MMEGYANNLSYYLNRLSNYSVSTIKLMPLGSTDVGSSGVVQVVLPSTGILALPSFGMRFTVETALGTDGVGLPRNYESLIQRMSVELNGAVVQNPCDGYNDLFNILANNTCGAYGHSLLRAVNNGDVPWVAAAGARGAMATGNAVLPPQAAQEAVYGAINHWLGFIGSAQPQYLLADILGDLRITLTLANNSVLCTKADDTAAGSWSMKKIYFVIDVCRIQDGVYNSMIERRLASGVPIEIPFTGIYQFTNNQTTMGQSTKFSVSSQSLDRVICTTVATGMQVGTPGGRPAAGKLNTPNTLSENSGYFTYSNADSTNNQLLVNSEYYPTFPQEAPYDFSYSQKNLNQAVDVLSATGQTWNGRGAAGLIQAATATVAADKSGLAQYLGGKWAFIVNFKHLGGDASDRTLSGINSYGSASNMYYNSNAGGNVFGGAALFPASGTGFVDYKLLIYCETTSVLRCLAGKVLEIVA